MAEGCYLVNPKYTSHCTDDRLTTNDVYLLTILCELRLLSCLDVQTGGVGLNKDKSWKYPYEGRVDVDQDHGRGTPFLYIVSPASWDRGCYGKCIEEGRSR